MASLTQWIWVEQTVGVSDGLESLACCSPWGHKESDTTEQLNNSNWMQWREGNDEDCSHFIIQCHPQLLEKFISSLGAREISLPLRNFIFHSFSLWELILNIRSYFSFSFDRQEIQNQIFLLSIKNCVGLLSVYSHFNFLYFPALNFLYNAMKW